MGIVLLILGLVLGIACFVSLIMRLVKFSKLHIPGEEKATIDKDLFTKLLIHVGIQCAICIICSLGFVLSLGLSLKGFEYVLLIIGSILFAGAFDTLVSSFGIYFYKPDLIESQKKLVKKVMFISIPVLIVGLIVLTEGFAREISYPLPAGFSFKNGIFYPDEGGQGFSVAWYGIVIVAGALVSYFITDHYVYKKYKKHGLIDTLFVVAFIGGILGARLWFCFVLERDYYLAFPGKIFNLVDGLSGLAIQGGAILGIITGVTFVLLFRKYIDLRFIMDVAVPSILIAQAIGRWGNFFNQEVFGHATSYENLWYLPTIIRNNMLCFSDVDKLVLYRVPLFIIESIINICGYFIIRFLCGKLFKCHIGLGYQSSFYLIWYGTVRAVLEPFRDGFTKNVGSSEAFGYMQSFITSFAMMGLGILLFILFIVLHKVRMKKGKENEYGEKI